jgi:TPR repeat protein
MRLSVLAITALLLVCQTALPQTEVAEPGLLPSNVESLRKAAEQGNAEAESSLGDVYHSGNGVAQDNVQAVFWWRKAAEQGESVAQSNLGVAYEVGQGVPQNYDQAILWFRKAADQGNVGAQSELGKVYYQGHGVPQDYVLAVAWFRKAAEQGDPQAQFNLGYIYANGQGVPKDDSQAAVWYGKAASQGLETARSNLRLLGVQGQAGGNTAPTPADLFPLDIAIDSTFETDISAISQQQQVQAATIGMELPYFAVFHGKINGEDHWVLGCRKENVLRESLPCTSLPVGEYRGRWIHDYNLLQIVGGPPERPIMRFLTVSKNVKSPPPPDDPVLHGAVFDFPVQFPNGQSVKAYPALVHVYGGASLEIPIGQLPAHSSCSVYTWSAYQTSVNCAAYPSIEIHRGYVTLNISAEAISFASLHCEAKWRWSHCAMLDPGLYYARVDKDRMVLLTHDVQGKPHEVTFEVELPREGAKSPIK